MSFLSQKAFGFLINFKKYISNYSAKIYIINPFIQVHNKKSVKQKDGESKDFTLGFAYKTKMLYHRKVSLDHY